MFDAYTVKKMLPRLVIAIIAIQLSWFLFTELINIVNLVAYSIEGLIYAPFGGANALQLKNILSSATGGGGNGLFFAGLITGGAAAVGAAVSLGGVLTLALTVMLALFIGFVMLMLRKVIIFFLLILSPLALVAWILPGTEKYFKLWWDSFFKLLLLYPMVLGVVAAGRVFAFAAASANQQPGAKIVTPISSISQLLIIVVGCFGPFFLIPKLFQLAGSTFSNITGMVNNRSKGAFDRLRNRRGETRKQNLEDLKAGNRFHGGNENNFRGRINRSLQTGSLLGRAGFDPRRMRSRINQAREGRAGTEFQELMEKNDDIKAVLPDDTLMEAVQIDRDRAAIEQRLINSGRYGAQGSTELAQGVALVERAQRAGSTTAVNSAMAVGRAATGTGYGNIADMHESILQAAGGNRQLEQALLGASRSASERARRPDLAAAGHVDQATAMNELRATMGTAGHAATREHVNAEMRRASFEAVGAHGIVSGRPQAVTDMVNGLQTDWDAAIAGGDIEGATEIASQITSLRGAMGSAPPAARQQIMGLMEHAGIDPGARNPQTGAAYSVDEQLGIILEGGAVGADVGPAIGPPTPAQQAQRAALQRAQTRTQEIRTRAGLYDAGGGDRTPDQLRASRPPDEE